MTTSEKELPESTAPDQQPAEGPAEPAPLQISLEGARSGRYRVTIEALNGDTEAISTQTFSITVPGDDRVLPGEIERKAPEAMSRTPSWRTWVGSALAIIRERARARGITLGIALFSLSLVIYLLVRLIALESFPIYFFTDEAAQTTLASDLVRDNFAGEDKVFLPTYFRNVYQFNLSVSVYLQVIPYLLFGKSLFVTRAVSVLFSLLVPLSVGLTLRNIFKTPYWWSGALVVSLAPAWFLHSRTAFETVLAVSFYAAFLYLYLLYRYRSPRFLYGAVALAALTFYSYSPAQVYIAATCFLLLISDARYHWSNRGIVARAAGLGVILALPFVRFHFLDHPEATTEHLAVLSSYWLEPIPFIEKLHRFGGEYLYGISPGYWFIPNDKDLSRHVMKGYGHLLRPMLPFMVLGLILALRGVRQSSYRVLLIAFLTAPLGAAIVEVGITRMLVFIVPASLLITMGISRILVWLERLRLPRSVLAAGLFAILGLSNVWMFNDALTNGPTWFTDYGLHGMQYGARQVFAAIQDELKTHPKDHIFLASSWANGADLLARFFLSDPVPLEMGGIDGFLREKKVIDQNSLFILPANEYTQAIESGKFTDFRVERLIPYPDGSPGFYMARFRYVDNIDAVLADEQVERLRLNEDVVSLSGEPVSVRYTTLDMGQIADVFDGDDQTLARTAGINPFVIELVFTEPHRFSGYDIVIGSADGELRTYLDAEQGQDPVEIVWPFEGSIDQPKVSVDFDGPLTAKIMRIEIHDFTQDEVGNVHVWELTPR